MTTPSLHQRRRATEITERIEKLQQELRSVLSGNLEVLAAEGASSNGRPTKPVK